MQSHVPWRIVVALAASASRNEGFFDGFQWVLMHTNQWVSMGFNGFNGFLMGFNGFQWVLMIFDYF